MAELRMEEQDKVRICLAMEEMLLRWRDYFGEEQGCVLKMERRLGGPQLRLELRGGRRWTPP